MKKFTAIILASLIMALPLYGCYGNNNTDENKTSITQTSDEEATESKEDISTFNTTMSNAQTIELAIKESMADIVSKNNEVYNGTTAYTDALGMKKIVPSASDTYTTMDKDGTPVTMHTISVADVAGIKAINEIFQTITYHNTEYNPYWLTDENKCVFLDSEGNSIDSNSYDINSDNAVPLTKDGIPDSEVYIDTLSKQFYTPAEQVDIPLEQ